MRRCGNADKLRLCKIAEATSSHVLSRDDHAASLTDTLENPEIRRSTLTVMPAGD